jgi:hypothetical protein
VTGSSCRRCALWPTSAFFVRRYASRSSRSLRSRSDFARISSSLRRSISTTFWLFTLAKLVTPVTLPPGRLRLATSPTSTGSAPVPKTIGISPVAALAASAEAVPPAVTRTATRSRTNSPASSGRRPVCACAHRHSILTFWPSTIARRAQALAEGTQTDRIRVRRGDCEKSDHRHRRLLRACR